MHPIKPKRAVALEDYSAIAEDHAYVEDLKAMATSDAQRMLDVGVDMEEKSRMGTFIQMDRSVVHCKSRQDGVDIMGISQAMDCFGGLKDYLWQNLPPDTDRFTERAKEIPHEGYFIRSRAGVRTEEPVQACLYISKDGFSQNVHNVVVAEEGSELHIITGCATSPPSGLRAACRRLRVFREKGGQTHVHHDS